MTIFYSAQQRGFYDSTLHSILPDDAKEISRENWQQLLLAQSQGKEIVGDENGFPVLTDPVPVPPEVSRFQLRAALHLAGLLNDVEAMMTDSLTDMIVRLSWQDTQRFQWNCNTMNAIARQLSMTEQQVQQLFFSAGEIKS